MRSPKIHNLTTWNQNKWIYGQLLKDYDKKHRFNKFEYDSICHTNLDNLFFELRNDYKLQYRFIEKLYQTHQEVIDLKYQDDQTNAYQQLTVFRYPPDVIDHELILTQVTCHPGDILDLKGYKGIGYYLVYKPENMEILYVKKTKDKAGRYLPWQGWQFIEEWGFDFYQQWGIIGCYLPVNVKLSKRKPKLQEKAKHGFLVFIPEVLMKDHSKAKVYKINGKKYRGKIKEVLPKN